MQKDGQNKLYEELDDYIPKTVITNKNRGKSWKYGYDDKYDMVVISKSGMIDSVVSVNGLKIALPKKSRKVWSRSKEESEQYWEVSDYPKELSRISSIFQWHESAQEFKDKWVDYIEEEFNRREEGMWFMNNGKPTYITGTHYMYLQWTKIDVGHPEFR